MPYFDFNPRPQTTTSTSTSTCTTCTSASTRWIPPRELELAVGKPTSPFPFPSLPTPRPRCRGALRLQPWPGGLAEALPRAPIRGPPSQRVEPIAGTWDRTSRGGHLYQPSRPHRPPSPVTLLFPFPTTTHLRACSSAAHGSPSPSLPVCPFLNPDYSPRVSVVPPRPPCPALAVPASPISLGTRRPINDLIIGALSVPPPPAKQN